MSVPVDGYFRSKLDIFVIFHHRSLCSSDKFEEPKDLPTPPKLFRVQRIARLKGMIYWERNIINELGLLYSVSSLNEVV